MNRDEAKAIFDSYFEGREKIAGHFGLKPVDLCDYDLDQCGEEWAICGGNVVWGPGQIPGQEPIPLSADDCCYSQEIVSVHRKEHFTLILMRLNMGGSDGAQIFENSKEQIPAEA